MIPQNNGIDFDFWNKCDFKSAYLLIKEAMTKVEGLASEELWNLLDECACELKHNATIEDSQK